MYSKFQQERLPVIPVKGKRPVIPSWSEYCRRLPTVEEATQWESKFPYPEYGYGLCLGVASGIIALDIDTDDKTVLQLCPESHVTKKGQKGQTRFFVNDPKIKTIKNLRQETGVEILADGCMTVIPPSIHPDTGEPYIYDGFLELWEGITSDLPRLDLSFLDKLKRNIIINETPIQTDGEGRNNRLKSIAWAMLKKNKPDTEIIEELLYIDRTEFQLGLFSDRNVKHRIRGLNPKERAITFFNNIKKSFIRLNNEDNYTESRENKLIVDYSNDLMGEPDEPIEWIIKDRISRETISIWAGAPKAGKSSLARYMGLCVANEDHFLTYPIENSGPVVFLYFEGKRKQHKRHLKTIGSKTKQPYIFVRGPRDEAPGLITEQIIQQFQPILIIIDNLGAMLPGKEFNTFEVMYPVLTEFSDIAEDHNIHIAMIHHVNKTANGRGFNGMMGSQAIRAGSDFNYVLDRNDKKDGERTLVSEQREGPDFKPRVLDFDPERQIHTLGKVIGSANEQIPYEVTQYFKEHSGGTLKGICKELVRGSTSVRKVLKQMVEDGKLDVTLKSGKNDSDYYFVP